MYKKFFITFLFFNFLILDQSNAMLKRSVIKVPQPTKMANTRFGENIHHPVLIFHDLLDDKESWLGFGEPIVRKTNKAVYMLDMRDHGKSLWTNEFTASAIEEDLNEFYAEKAIDQAILVGHGFSGIPLIRFALKYPDRVTKLILIDSNLKVRSDVEIYFIANYIKFLKSIPMIINQSGLTLAAINKIFDQFLIEIGLDTLAMQKLKSQFFKNVRSPNDDKKSEKVHWKFNTDAILNYFEKLYSSESSEFLNDLNNNPEHKEHKFHVDVLQIYGDKTVFKHFDKSAFLRMFPNSKFSFIEGGDHRLPFTKRDEFLEILINYLNEE